MSFKLIETPGRELAHTAYTLAQAPVYFDCPRKFGALDPCFKSPTFRFTHQSLAVLDNMRECECEQVMKEIASLAHNPAPPGSLANAANLLLRLWRSRYQFRNSHYLIAYSRSPADGGILICDIMIDENQVGLQIPTHQQQNALYYVERATQDRYRDVKNKDEAALLTAAWDVPVPTDTINTDHAAVNGMQNPLDKARWLMGAHLDVAYPEANVQKYTLFHNPSDGDNKLSTLTDVAECLWDKVAPIPECTSWQVRNLAELLLQRQWERRQTDWVVHSQGAIIFKAAVQHHLRTRPHVKLDRHTVAFHAGGSVISAAKPYLQQAGIKIGLERINPFDLVPNVAGLNAHSPSGLIRALSFTRLVFSGNSGDITVSPHTLPYLGICTYYLQLKEAGHHLAAGLVRSYMSGLNNKQLAYERSLNDPNARSLNTITKKPSPA